MIRSRLALMMALAMGMDTWSVRKPAARSDFGMPVATKVKVNFTRGPGKKRGKRK